MKFVKQAVSYWCEDIVDRKYLGKDVCSVILDTGIARHPDLKSRLIEYKNFTGKPTKYQDDSGHGTHVAGILAGDGRASEGTYSGMAPESLLVAGKVLDKEGNGNVENVIEGIEWTKSIAKSYHVKIVNISVGTQPDLAEKQQEKLLKAVESLWDMGLIVVVSAGNFGPRSGSVAVPGSSRKVITVGVPDSRIKSSKTRVNYSGRGPTKDCVVKPDLFAPGTGIISCNSRYGFSGEHAYIMKSGTSMSTPVVSGAIACLLSKYPYLSNKEIKLRLRTSCVQTEGTEFGWGMLNVRNLMEAGESLETGQI